MSETTKKAILLIDERLGEIRAEEARLLAAREELVPSAPKARPSGNAGRKPERLNQFVAIVQDNPGLKTAEIAHQMKLRPNYLYRIANQAVERGLVKKDGISYLPA